MTPKTNALRSHPARETHSPVKFTFTALTTTFIYQDKEFSRNLRGSWEATRLLGQDELREWIDWG